jgi:hypothetical protein
MVQFYSASYAATEWLAFAGGAIVGALRGFTRYSRDRGFVVLGENRSFVLVMAAGSIVGSFIGGRLLGQVPLRRILHQAHRY